MNYYDYLLKAKGKISELKSGTVFEVKDLYEPLEWKKLSTKEKQSFGRYFSSNFNDGQIPNIKRCLLEKKGANKYIKE